MAAFAGPRGASWGRRCRVAPSADEQLLRALHDEHGGALWRYVMSLTAGDHARSQDVVQETFLRAWRSPKVLANATAARGWLFTVAKRIVIDEWRTTRSRHEFVSAELPEQSVADASEHTLDRHILDAAMAQLSEQHRAVLAECYLRGSTVNEAAAALGIAPGTVKSRTHYALRALRTAVDELGDVR